MAVVQLRNRGLFSTWIEWAVENNPACDIYTLEHFKEAIKIYILCKKEWFKSISTRGFFRPASRRVSKFSSM